MSRIDEIRSRERVATPGPWKHFCKGMEFGNGTVLHGDIDHCVVSLQAAKNIGPVFRGENADFISYAREDIPFLLAENERLTAQVERLVEELASALHACNVMTIIIQGVAYDRCDHCILRAEPCPERGLNADCCFGYVGTEDERWNS